MTSFDNPLDHVRVAAPCKVNWERMIGTDRVRFCGQCTLNVYNLSSMTKHEAESFIAGNEGRLCVRFYRRTDGSILTKNCPVGLRAIRRRLSSVGRAVASTVFGFLAGLGVYETLATVRFKEPARMGVMVQDQGMIAFPERATVGEMIEERGRPIFHAESKPRREKGHVSRKELPNRIVAE